MFGRELNISKKIKKGRDIKMSYKTPIKFPGLAWSEIELFSKR